ncbi:hypothetical protein F0562_007639 [Nyssa sinensis]|uniref:Uncharacterized protein n=1 Tax=Nyssa sinensis TaxID=561372 RepID=A0A5J5A6G1_9ASTE|nr:hypothetical protein F0562_007639 [Nyssa sinensis]
MESLHGDSSSPSIREASTMAALEDVEVEGEGLLADSRGGMQEYGRSNTEKASGCDGRSGQSLQEGVKSDGAAYLNHGICGNSKHPMR